MSCSPLNASSGLLRSAECNLRRIRRPVKRANIHRGIRGKLFRLRGKTTPRRCCGVHQPQLVLLIVLFVHLVLGILFLAILAGFCFRRIGGESNPACRLSTSESFRHRSQTWSIARPLRPPARSPRSDAVRASHRRDRFPYPPPSWFPACLSPCPGCRPAPFFRSFFSTASGSIAVDSRSVTNANQRPSGDHSAWPADFFPLVN